MRQLFFKNSLLLQYIYFILLDGARAPFRHYNVVQYVLLYIQKGACHDLVVSTPCSLLINSHPLYVVI